MFSIETPQAMLFPKPDTIGYEINFRKATVWQFSVTIQHGHTRFFA
jgi:hypothetical protein